MLLWLKALGMCQSMFCAIPCFWHGWDERARGKMLLCLPFVGLEIGLLWWGAGILSRFLSPLLGAAVLAFFPWIATGALHLDGFLDVVDAVRSCRNLERMACKCPEESYMFTVTCNLQYPVTPGSFFYFIQALIFTKPVFIYNLISCIFHSCPY